MSALCENGPKPKKKLCIISSLESRCSSNLPPLDCDYTLIKQCSENQGVALGSVLSRCKQRTTKWWLFVPETFLYWFQYFFGQHYYTEACWAPEVQKLR